MSIENVKKFYIYASEDEYLAEALEKINNEIRKGNLVAEKLKELINLKIIPLAKEKGFDFTAEDLIGYSQELVKGLSDEDLALVSGGIQPKTAAVALAITLGSSFLSAGVINLISNTPTQNQAIMSSSTSNEAKEKNRNRDSEASKDEHAEPSRKKSINNLQDNMKETLKDKKVTLPSQKVKNSKLAKDFASMNDKFGDSKDQSKLLDTKKNVDELNEDIEVAAKDQDDTKELSSMPNVAIDAESDKKNDDFSSSSTKYVNAFGNIENGAGGTSVKDSTYKSIGETKEETDTKTTSTSESKPELDASSSTNATKPTKNNNKVKEKTTVVDYYEGLSGLAELFSDTANENTKEETNVLNNTTSKSESESKSDTSSIKGDNQKEIDVENKKKEKVEDIKEVFSASNENVNAGSNKEEENNNKLEIEKESRYEYRKENETNIERANRTFKNLKNCKSWADVKLEGKELEQLKNDIEEVFNSIKVGNANVGKGLYVKNGPFGDILHNKEKELKKIQKFYHTMYTPFRRSYITADSQAKHLLDTLNLINSFDEIEKGSRDAIEKDIEYIAEQIVFDLDDKKAIDNGKVIAKESDTLILSGQFSYAATSSDNLQKILSFYEQIKSKQGEKAANENNEEEDTDDGIFSAIVELFNDNDNNEEKTKVINNTTSTGESKSKSDTSSIKGDNQKEIDVENKKEEENKDSKNELEETKDQNEDLKEVNENNKKDSANTVNNDLNKINTESVEVVESEEQNATEVSGASNKNDDAGSNQQEEKQDNYEKVSTLYGLVESDVSRARRTFRNLKGCDSWADVKLKGKYLKDLKNDIKEVYDSIEVKTINGKQFFYVGGFFDKEKDQPNLRKILKFYNTMYKPFGRISENADSQAKHLLNTLSWIKSLDEIEKDSRVDIENDIKHIAEQIVIYKGIFHFNQKAINEEGEVLAESGDELKLSGKFLNAPTSSEKLHTILKFYEKIKNSYEKGGYFETDVSRARRTFRNLRGYKSWADVKLEGKYLKDLKNDIKKVYNSIEVKTSNGECFFYVGGLLDEEKDQYELQKIRRFYNTIYTSFNSFNMLGATAGEQAKHLIKTLDLINSLDEIEKDSRAAIENDIKHIAKQIVIKGSGKNAINEEGKVLAKGTDDLKLKGKIFNAPTSQKDLRRILNFYKQIKNI